MDASYLEANLLGSGGKKETSGDLDINVDITKLQVSDLDIELVQILGKDNVKSRPGTNQIFTAVPIQGGGDSVQIDFMFGDVAWQAFSYWSSTSSQYKGLYRTELIKALVAFKSDWVLIENDIMVARVGPTFFHDNGIVWRYRHRPFKKDGSTRIKELKEISGNEFKELYPSSLPASGDVEIDPYKVMKLILPNSPYEAHDSFESLWFEVCKEYDLDDRSTIREIYLERLNSLKADIPQGVKDALERDH